MRSIPVSVLFSGAVLVLLDGLAGDLHGQALKAAPAPAVAPAARDAAAAPASDNESWNSAGFAVPFDRKVVAHFRELDEHLKNGAWSKAFRLLADASENSWTGMLPDRDGFLVPAGNRLAETLRNLSPEGRAAFRVFFEPTARQLMASLKSPDATPDRDTRVAETVYNRYFLTDSGDEAAAILGDSYFQRGEFLKAERCWRAILENHPDSSIPEIRLLVKCGVSLIRAGQVERFHLVREALALRFAGQKVILGGREYDALSYLDELAAKSGLETTISAAKESSSDLPHLSAPMDDAKPLWQFHFRTAPKESATKQGANRNNQVIVRQGNQAFAVDSQSLAGMYSNYVPNWDVDDQRLYFNWFGACCAVDLNTGKDIWRTPEFQLAMQRATSGTNENEVVLGGWKTSSTPFPILVADGVVLAGYEAAFAGNDQQGMPNQPLSALAAYEAESGKPLWRSETVPALKGCGFLGNPVIHGAEAVVVSQRPDSAEWILRSIDLRSGKELWSLGLGTAQMITDGRRGIPMAPTPTLLVLENVMYILTNNGALVSVNLAERQVSWVYKFESASAGQDGRGDDEAILGASSMVLGGGDASMEWVRRRVVLQGSLNRMLCSTWSASCSDAAGDRFRESLLTTR
jgi:outer membrane protein assembly factor BamB